jgi:crotonobetainyl-CoA:carnitine CoA-transferase CaiB-like acyl-CoA transferase
VENLLPLEGIRVLDLSQIMAGPFCAMVLADLGADVIKIEKPNGGDDSRQMGPFVNGESVCYFQINRNKRGVCLDLKSAEGLELFYELVKTADILIENFRPGVTKSLKIDYETLHEINPGLVYGSISGYGQTGPYAHKGGFDLIAQGMTGLMAMTGYPDKPPAKAGVAVYDIGAGLTAAYGILAAYIQKQRTGIGQHVDVSLAESGLPWYAWEAAAYFGAGELPKRTGSRHRVSAPYQAYRTRDGYVVLGCANQRNWEKFCRQVVNRPEWLDDPRFRTNSDRARHADDLEVLIEEVFGTQDSAHWLERCEAAGVPAGPIYTLDDVVRDPHYLARDMVVEVEHPVIGRMKMFGIPTKYSEEQPTVRRAAPLLGQHTDEVLSELGVGADRLQALRDRGVIR